MVKVVNNSMETELDRQQIMASVDRELIKASLVYFPECGEGLGTRLNNGLCRKTADKGLSCLCKDSLPGISRALSGVFLSSGSSWCVFSELVLEELRTRGKPRRINVRMNKRQIRSKLHG